MINCVFGVYSVGTTFSKSKAQRSHWGNVLDMCIPNQQHRGMLCCSWENWMCNQLNRILERVYILCKYKYNSGSESGCFLIILDIEKVLITDILIWFAFLLLLFVNHPRLQLLIQCIAIYKFLH